MRGDEKRREYPATIFPNSVKRIRDKKTAPPPEKPETKKTKK